jgi:hypothetical protein
MAINPTLPPTVDEFRKVFPEFVDVSDEQVQFYLDTAMQWIDTFWYPIDAKLAVLYAAAHYLYLHDQASGGTITGGSESGGGGVVADPEVGKIWVKSVRFRDRQVTYDRVAAGADKQGGGASTSSAASEFWESTPYGEMYLSFRRRNVPHVAVV